MSTINYNLISCHHVVEHSEVVDVKPEHLVELVAILIALPCKVAVIDGNWWWTRPK